MIKTREIDMTKGPIFKTIITCAIPFFIMNVLQVLFHAADIAVISIYRGDNAAGSVGATANLITLTTNIFIGVSAGSNVVLAKCKGKGDIDGARRVVGTSVFISLISGVVLLVVGLVVGRPLLRLMDCPGEQLELASTYLRVYFIGVPAVMLYNFLAAILRAVGDTFRPMVFLTIGGVLNVILNVVFVRFLGMSVEGVAIATIISQAFAAVCCLIVVLKNKEYCKFQLKYFKIYLKELKGILLVGIPSGVQASLFSLSNVFLQSAVFRLGANAVSANTYSTQFDGLVYHVGYAVATSCMSFVSQNYGAGDVTRIKKGMKISALTILVSSLGFGGIVAIFSKQLLGLMTDSQEIIALAQIRLVLISLTHFICGTMDMLSQSMRALGKAISSMVICLIGACGLRIVWINTIYHLNETFGMIYLSYPITWLLTAVVLLAVLISHLNKIEKVFETKKDN